MKYILLFIILFKINLLFAQKSKLSVSDSLEILKTENQFNQIDNILKLDSAICKLNPIYPSYDPTTIIYFYDKKRILRKLKYSLFEDGGKSVGFAQKYFDSTGTYFGSRSSQNNSYFLFYKSLFFVSINKESINGKKKIVLHVLNQPTIINKKIAELSKSINDYTQCVDNVTYKSVIPSKSAPSILENFETITVFEKPEINSKKVIAIQPNQKIVYLGSTNKPFVVNKLKWSWYKISINGIEGWIFGHPSIVDLIANHE